MIAQLALVSMLALAPPTTSPVCHDPSNVASHQPTDFDASLQRAAEYQSTGNYRLAMDILCPLREETRARDDKREFMLATVAMGWAIIIGTAQTSTSDVT